MSAKLIFFNSYQFYTNQSDLFMKNFLMILLFLASTSVFAQRITITGTVTDEGGSPLGGTTVLVKGTTMGAITDANGKYSIDVDNRNVTLVFSFIGFITQEVAVQNRAVVDVILKAEITGLDEVIVVGYGTQKKSDITGTVSSLNKDRLEMAPNLNVTQAIMGAVPGVLIQTNSAGADPDQSIMIRGRSSISADNSPLIIVDGIPYGGSMSDINPKDIGSVEILKDASAAAIYGSRGSNGVILITTKEGVSGKTVFSYDGKYGISQFIKKYDFLNGPEFYDFKMTRDPAYIYQTETDNLAEGVSTDWFSLALRRGQSQEHNVSVSGGFRDTKFYIGAGLTDIIGVAAIYGSRGANGVILISTKQGTEGKTVFSYDGKYSIQKVVKIHDMLTGPEFYNFKMERNPSAMTLSETEAYQNNTWTDWFSLMVRTGQPRSTTFLFQEDLTIPNIMWAVV